MMIQCICKQEYSLCTAGSYLEGGGQILRNSALVGALTNQPVRIINIRAGRSPPGLRPQHLASLMLVADICGGELQGGTVGSTEVRLIPGRITKGTYAADPQTAGSITLMIQAALPLLLLARDSTSSTLDLSGGTDVSNSPPVSYIQYVLLPVLTRTVGIASSFVLQRRGFYPKGGGHVQMHVHPLPLREGRPRIPPLMWVERGKLQRIVIRVFSDGPNVKNDMADKIGEGAKLLFPEELREKHMVRVIVGCRARSEALEVCAGVLVTAEYHSGVVLGASATLEKGKRRGSEATSEEELRALGEQAAKELQELQSVDTCADDWLQDQLVVFMALAAGTSRLRCRPLTSHTRTGIAIMSQLLGAKFTEYPQPNGTVDLVCESPGLQQG